MKKILFLIMLSLSSLAHAGNLHLLAGGGVNMSSFQAENSGQVIGAGLNFKTDLGYYFTDQWALDWGVAVKFNKLSETLIWDTLMTIGPRYQFRDSPYFTRAFWGRAPTVFYNKGFLKGEGSSDRIQFDGPVMGLAFGKLHTASNKNIWYWEVAAMHQKLEDRVGIENDGDIPVETFRGNSSSKIDIISVLVTIGMRIF